jgi:hypothetical protein
MLRGAPGPTDKKPPGLPGGFFFDAEFSCFRCRKRVTTIRRAAAAHR